MVNFSLHIRSYEDAAKSQRARIDSASLHEKESVIHQIIMEQINGIRVLEEARQLIDIARNNIDALNLEWLEASKSASSARRERYESSKEMMNVKAKPTEDQEKANQEV